MREKIHWIVDIATDYWLPVSMIVVPILLTVATALLGDEVTRALGLEEVGAKRVQWWALMALFVLIVIHFVLSILQIKAHCRHSNLTKELQKTSQSLEVLVSNAKALCDGYLQDLADGALRFGSNGNNTERITLYVHDSLSQFQPIGRFSWNPSFKKQGRALYPDDQGCIAQAWQNGWYCAVLPDSSAKLDEWVTECNKLGVPKGVARNLNMKSVFYCCCSVSREGSTGPVGVLVVESTDLNRFTEQTVRDVLTDDRRNYIARMLETLRPWLGDEGEAKERGF